MKKIKLFLLGAAALFGVTAAFAFTTVGPCDDPANPQYYLDANGNPHLVTTPTYVCEGSTGICTFVVVDGVTYICKNGKFKG